LASEESSGRLDSRIRSIVGHTPYEIVWHSVYRFHTRVAERMRVGRVLLAGDNAHLVAPFGARGLNSGVQDAENAAWKLAYVRNGWADEELLESYHTERHAAALENAEVTGATMRFLVPQCHEEHRMRRATLDRAVTDPTAHPAVDSGRLAEPFWYTDSTLTTPCPQRPLTARPPHVPRRTPDAPRQPGPGRHRSHGPPRSRLRTPGRTLLVHRLHTAHPLPPTPRLRTPPTRTSTHPLPRRDRSRRPHHPPRRHRAT